MMGYILFAWVGAQLNAPAWYWIAIGFSAVVRFGSFMYKTGRSDSE